MTAEANRWPCSTLWWWSEVLIRNTSDGSAVISTASSCVSVSPPKCTYYSHSKYFKVKIGSHYFAKSVVIGLVQRAERGSNVYHKFSIVTHRTVTKATCIQLIFIIMFFLLKLIEKLLSSFLDITESENSHKIFLSFFLPFFLGSTNNQNGRV